MDFSLAAYGTYKEVKTVKGTKPVTPVEEASVPDPSYIPRDATGKPIPLKKHGDLGNEIPLPDPLAEGRPHTTLGGKNSSLNNETYRQTAEFNDSWPKANGEEVPISEVHWGDHGQPHHHPNPHQHVFTYDWEQKRWIRGAPEKFNPRK